MQYRFASIGEKSAPRVRKRASQYSTKIAFQSKNCANEFHGEVQSICIYLYVFFPNRFQLILSLLSFEDFPLEDFSPPRRERMFYPGEDTARCNRKFVGSFYRTAKSKSNIKSSRSSVIKTIEWLVQSSPSCANGKFWNGWVRYGKIRRVTFGDSRRDSRCSIASFELRARRAPRRRDDPSLSAAVIASLSFAFAFL